MAKLTIVVGLPGSGKSTLIERVMNSIPGVCIEDYMKNSINYSRLFTYSRHYETLIGDLLAGKDCIIADIIFCDTACREDAVRIVRQNVPDVEIEWLFFENAPEKCKINAIRRNSQLLQQELEYIRLLSVKYQIPDGAKVVDVYSGAVQGDPRIR